MTDPDQTSRISDLEARIAALEERTRQPVMVEVTGSGVRHASLAASVRQAVEAAFAVYALAVAQHIALNDGDGDA